MTDGNDNYLAVRYPADVQAEVDAGQRYNHHCITYDENVYDTFGADEYYPHSFEQDQLYDLDADPEEQQNVADDPDHQDRLEPLHAELREYSTGLPHEFGEFT